MDEKEAEVAAGDSTIEGDGTKTTDSLGVKTLSQSSVATTEKEEQEVTLSEECPPAAQPAVEHDAAENPVEQKDAVVTLFPLEVPSTTTTAKDAESNTIEMDASGPADKRALEAACPTTSTNISRGLEQIN